MTQEKHTPTPWSINSWTEKSYHVRIGAKGTPTVCDIPLTDQSMNEQKANAALIVKAVNNHENLLDMVYRVLPYIEDLSSDERYKPGAIKNLTKEIRELIITVEGKK